MAKKRGQGEGSVRLRRGTYWVRFRVGGVRYERKTNATTKTEALTVLRDVIAGAQHLPSSRVTVRDLYSLIVDDYENRRQRVGDVAKRWGNLEPMFGDLYADAVTTRDLNTYIRQRRREKAADATIQRELACLRRMYRLAHQQSPRLVDDVPKFPTIRVENSRQGFFERDQYEAVLGELPDYLRPIAVFAYWTGWRRGEILSLRRDQLDLERGAVRLDPEQSKNREGRTIYLPDDVRGMLDGWNAQTMAFERETGRVVRFVFHRNGKPIRDFYGAWRAACERAGVPDARFHDFRRTAARNYIRAGVPERVAMRVLGHRTRSIFDRYNVSSEADMEQAARLMSAPTPPPPKENRGRKRPPASRRKRGRKLAKTRK